MIFNTPDCDSLQWFDEARFGLFIHFGLYAMVGHGEWCMYRDPIPRDQYERLPKRFNPHRFDADHWVDFAEASGAKYIIVTTKHHDGFCMFDSQLTDYKITNTPFGRDLIGELVAACQRRNMRIVLYYSQPDWHHRNFVHRPHAFKDFQDPPADQRPDWDRFLDYYIGQVRELCTQYGKIDGIWFDGSHRTEAEWRGREVYRMIKKHQPTAVVNGRAGCGDFYTPERAMPDDLSGFRFEVCDSVLTKSWGYHPESPLYSQPHLVQWLIRVIARGGNYVLNVGPRPDGTIDPEQTKRLHGVGRWIQKYSSAVYGTKGHRFGGDEPICATRRGKRVFVMLPSWPATDHLTLPGKSGVPTRARLLGANRTLKIEQSGPNVVLKRLPAKPTDTLASVIELEYAQEPREAPRPRQKAAPVIAVQPDRRTQLEPGEARCVGRGIKGAPLRQLPDSHGGSERVILSHWLSHVMSAVWRIDCQRAGLYEARVLIRCDEHYAGSQYRIGVPGSHCDAVVKPTPGTQFRWQRIGKLQLRTGQQKLVLRPLHLALSYFFADVAAVALRPI